MEGLQKNFPEWTVSARVERGSPASEILNFAEGWHPDLIVVGSHGRSAVGRLVLGSVSQKVVTEARCSVRVARGKVDVEPAALRSYRTCRWSHSSLSDRIVFPFNFEGSGKERKHYLEGSFEGMSGFEFDRKHGCIPPGAYEDDA